METIGCYNCGADREFVEVEARLHSIVDPYCCEVDL